MHALLSANQSSLGYTVNQKSRLKQARAPSIFLLRHHGDYTPRKVAANQSSPGSITQSTEHIAVCPLKLDTEKSDTPRASLNSLA